MNNLIEINNLSKSYYSLEKESLIIDNISFNINKGEFITIIGPSGCGKSTLLNIIGNLDKDYTGKLLYKDRIKISYMLQEDALFPWLNVFENACLGLKIQNKLTKENKEYVLYLLNKYGLKNFINTKVTSLSGGMKQRVALIRTIAVKPNLVLLDEPFSALDYQTRLKVSNDVYKILKEENITALMVTHDISEAASISSKAIVMSKRPTKIKNIYTLSYKEETPLERRNSLKFREYYELLWRDIDDNE